MGSESLWSVDFATLRTFQQVYRLKSFSKASEKLDINQSGVSYAIDRLRKAFSDPLFVRQGGGIAPTDRCRQVILSVDEILSKAEAMSTTNDFDPAEAEHKITIGCDEYARMIFMPEVVKRTIKEAPGITLSLVNSLSNIEELLANGEIDIAFSPIQLKKSGIYGRRIFDDVFVCGMDANNPLAGKKLTLADYSAARHFGVDLGPKFIPAYRQRMKELGIKIEYAVKTPSNADIARMVSGTDCIATMASRTVAKFPNELVIAKCPVEAKVTGTMYWNATTHHNPAQMWLRQVITEVTDALPPPLEV
jgi:DNA-binding transcriptional LysR family regulator